MCKSKKEGGLGIKPLKMMNQAPLSKWLRRLGDPSQGLRRQLLMAKRFERGMGLSEHLLQSFWHLERHDVN